MKQKKNTLSEKQLNTTHLNSEDMANVFGGGIISREEIIVCGDDPRFTAKQTDSYYGDHTYEFYFNGKHLKNCDWTFEGHNTESYAQEH